MAPFERARTPTAVTEFVGFPSPVVFGVVLDAGAFGTLCFVILLRSLGAGTTVEERPGRTEWRD